TQPAATAKVYLGNNAGAQYKSDGNGCESIGLNLLTDTAARVDISGLTGNLASTVPITFPQLKQGQLGNLRVRKMSVIVHHGQDANQFASHKGVFKDGNVNGFTAASSLQVVTGLTRTFDLSTNGVSMVIQKLTGQ